MKKQIKTTAGVGDKIDAATLAAASVLQYFKDRKWTIISFFPNSVCVHAPCCKKRNSKK